MPTLNSYIASIVVNGQKLTEYDPPEAEQISDRKKCVKYVEADEGSNFVVYIDLTPQTRFTTPNKIVRIYIDGKSAKASVIRAERTHRGLHHEYSKRAILEVGGLVEQAFMFQKLITTEETLEVEELKKTAKGVGSIRLEIYNGTADKSVPRGSRHTQESVGAIPEKALKGQPIDMMAGYGEKKPVRYRNVSNSKIVGKAEAVFEFKYRSRRALQLLDLVPTTPEPEALESRDPNTLNLQEARLLVSQYQQRESPAPRVTPGRVKKEKFNVKVEGEQTENESRKRPASFIDDDELQIVDVKRCKPITIDEVDVLDLS